MADSSKNGVVLGTVESGGKSAMAGLAELGGQVHGLLIEKTAVLGEIVGTPEAAMAGAGEKLAEKLGKQDRVWVAPLILACVFLVEMGFIHRVPLVALFL